MATFKFNFPSSPTVGQKYTVGNKQWTWNGFAWAVPPSLAGGGASVTVGLTAPEDANIGDLWWNSSSEFSGLFMYYMYLDADENDEEIYQWIQVGTSESGIYIESPPLEIGGSDSGTTIFGTTYDGGSSSSIFNNTINGGGS